MHRRLEAFAEGGRDSLPVPLLILDEALARAVQTRLAHHGLLDPPGDGFLGRSANGRWRPSAKRGDWASTGR